ncbi:baseplate wedge subunit and tail pin [Escherichia phage AV119]|mgnify:CR=1 FL=1|uniref:Baseplate wedge protein gp10 n=1 Tax=Yersinia phage fPS-90 TaxID=2052932 RepID=A0A449C3Q1_9CAUD|nr:baseplate wedge subunit [Yersinia phage fPS-90]WPK36482.1 baseplate wedge subunit and tail pin [Escherichia phage AV119]WPK36757.1 baseplate wedge subunit and tail pin [Escherichia phage AV120]VEV89002.1 Phage baseplate wedge subunit and tail pin (T4-like gp10) [Yersinia phage fPS-90]
MKQNINIGNVVDDGTGDYLRKGGIKINENFDELYYELGDGDVPYSAGAWKTYNASSGQTLKAKWGKSYAINTSSGRVTLQLPKGTVNDYNKVIRARDVFATWNINPVTLVAASGDTIKGSSSSVEINIQFSDLELVYCAPGRWEYVKNKQIDKIISSDISNVARKEFLVEVQGQTDFLDVFHGTSYNVNNIRVKHRGNELYYGDVFSENSDFGSPGENEGELIPLDGFNIRLRQPCNIGDTVQIETFMDGVSQWRSSYTRRQIKVLDSKLTSKTSLEGSIYVTDLSAMKSIPFSAFGLIPGEPINPNSLEVRFNGILQQQAGTAGYPLFLCEGANSDTQEGCISLGGEWKESNTDYSIEYEDGKPTSLLFDRKFESGDIIVITWFNNDLGTLLEKDDIIELTDDRYVSKGSSTEVTGDVALTDFDKIGWPNVEKVDSYTRTYNSISSIFDSIYPVGSIYENAINPNNPVTYMGFGSWKLFGKGQVLVGWNDDVTDPNFALNNNDLDSSGNPSHTAGGTVGTTSVTLENANLPATKTDEKVLIEDENGSVIIGGCQYDPDETGPIYTKYREDYATTNSSHTPPTNISNIQPSITVYRWIRIA